MDMATLGWVAPLGHLGEQLTHQSNGCIMVCLRREEKVLPAAVVREIVNDKVLEIETELRDLQENYLPDHRAIVRVERRMRALEQVRDSKIDEIMRRNLEAQLKQLQNQVQSLQTTLDMLEDEYEAKKAELLGRL